MSDDLLPAPLTPHPRRRISISWIVLLLLCSILGFLIYDSCGQLQHTAKVTNEQRAKEAQRAREQSHQEFIGSRILKDYGAPNRDAKADLNDMANALGNFAKLVKGADPLPLGANEDIARALLGRNKAKLVFLPKDSPALNERGQLIDRWGTPLYFHANSATNIDIRSAGPDKTMWTADDLHRAQDGGFLKGDALNPPSLRDKLRELHKTTR